jgi:RNA polymerase sigma factor (sigma-70 family)
VREQTDTELVAAARRGDRGAFTALLDRHDRAVRAVVARLLALDEAEDVVQEAFLQAYLGLDRLRQPARFGSWLCAIAVNLAKMRVRSRKPVLGGSLDGAGPTEVDTAEVSELVREALATLPAREREALLLTYVEGLTSPEVASLTGERPGTVRVRLHRARSRMRELLRPPKEVTMVEVTLEDVVVRVAEDNGEPRIADEHVRIVLLKEKGGERVLPIWIGAPEAAALALELGGEATPRPMTADLMAKLLGAADASVERVTVNSLREDTFYATIALSTGGGEQEVDARPSDALNLAVRVGAPIFVDDAVMEHAFTGDLDEKVREEEERRGIEPVEGAEWRSFSPEMVKALYPPFPPKRT